MSELLINYFKNKNKLNNIIKISHDNEDDYTKIVILFESLKYNYEILIWYNNNTNKFRYADVHNFNDDFYTLSCEEEEPDDIFFSSDELKNLLNMLINLELISPYEYIEKIHDDYKIKYICGGFVPM